MRLLKVLSVLMLIVSVVLIGGKCEEPVPTPTPCVACIRSFRVSEGFENWLETVESWEDLKSFVDSCDFAFDIDLFGVVDYWQTPDQFFHSKVGDCDCYSWFISYVFLKRLGAKKAYVLWMVEYMPEPRGHMYSIVELVENEFTVVNINFIKGTTDTIEGTVSLFGWRDPVIIQIDEVK